MIKYSTIHVYYDSQNFHEYPKRYPDHIRITGSDQKEIRRIQNALHELKIIDRQKSNVEHKVIKYEKKSSGAIRAHSKIVCSDGVIANMTIKYMEDSEELMIYGGNGHVSMNEYIPYLPNWVENYLLEAGYEPYATTQLQEESGYRPGLIQFYKKPHTEEKPHQPQEEKP